MNDWKRRRLIQAGFAVPLVRWGPVAAQSADRNLLATERKAAAAAAPTGASLLIAPRHALVIGNSSYGFGPLKNPANDAKALGAELKQAGFQVTVGLDLTRKDMLEAIRAYGESLNKAQAIGLFYFAGHGLQLAWRNYLVPTDATIAKMDDIQTKCVDVNAVIEGIAKAVNPMNVVILDACRENPFGSDVKLDQKGLSQLDAPPGTILAYATAPGNLASDGDGANGLYTEQLLREMKVPEAKIEDVFKRVRLTVRRRSNGQQIPWESTSLEEDFWFIPPKEMQKLAVAEAERVHKEKEAERLWQERIEKAQREETERLRREAEAEKARQEKIALAQREEAERLRREAEAERARQERIAKAQREEAERLRREAQAEKARQEKIALAQRDEAERLRREADAERAKQEAVAKVRREEAEQLRREAETEKARQEKIALAQREDAERLRREAEAERVKQETITKARREEAERLKREAETERARLETEEKKRHEQLARVYKEEQERRRKQEDSDRAYEEELRFWERVSSAKEPGPIEEYLRRYPSGRFCEIAQVQLDRILALQGEKRVEAVSPAANPYSQGSATFKPAYKVGDMYTYNFMDLYSKVVAQTNSIRITEITDTQVIYNNGRFITDLLGSPILQADGRRLTPSQLAPTEYRVGKKWRTRFNVTHPRFGEFRNTFDIRIVARERITVPAGTFDCYRMETTGQSEGQQTVRFEATTWMAPDRCRRGIARNEIRRNQYQIIVAERQELVAFQQS
ncbi:MAG: hypothetical protein QOD26_1417 [Betaproteobacteria bacterium]|jgi:uncharacterized caspase-like protein|nr:hypothetical protein [Betaproteobacteria bacterium]